MIDFGRHHDGIAEGQANQHSRSDVPLNDKPGHDKNAFVIHREGISDVKARHKTGVTTVEDNLPRFQHDYDRQNAKSRHRGRTDRPVPVGVGFHRLLSTS